MQNHPGRTLASDPSHAPADVPDCLAHPVHVVEVVKGDQFGAMHRVKKTERTGSGILEQINPFGGARAKLENSADTLQH